MNELEIDARHDEGIRQAAKIASVHFSDQQEQIQSFPKFLEKLNINGYHIVDGHTKFNDNIVNIAWWDSSFPCCYSKYPEITDNICIIREPLPYNNSNIYGEKEIDIYCINKITHDDILDYAIIEASYIRSLKIMCINNEFSIFIKKKKTSLINKIINKLK